MCLNRKQTLNRVARFSAVALTIAGGLVNASFYTAAMAQSDRLASEVANKGDTTARAKKGEWRGEMATLLAGQRGPTSGGAAIFKGGTPSQSSQTASGLAPGENIGGVVDRVYVMAPPNWSYVLETQAGSFVDCGDDTQNAKTDADGRDAVGLNCGVTLSETLVIPAAARSARVVVHH